MLVAMGMAAVLCIAIGVFPSRFTRFCPIRSTSNPTPASMSPRASALMFTALGFVLFLRALDPENTISIDTDWFYRKGARYFMWLAEKPLARYEKAVSDVSETAALPFLHGSARAGLRIDLNGVDAVVNGVARAILRGGGAAAAPDRRRDPLRAGDDRRRDRGHRHIRRGVAVGGAMAFPLLSLIVFLPAAGAAVLMFLRNDDAVRWTALGVTVLDFALCIAMLAGFDTTTHEMQFTETRPWVPALGITYALGVDGISALFVFLTSLLGWICVLASWVAIDRKVKEFMVSLLACRR